MGAGEAIRQRLLGESAIYAPHLIDLEILSAFRRLAQGRRVGGERLRQAFEDLADLALIRLPHYPLRDRIWSLRSSLTSYDAAYVALAERLGTVVLTVDRRLARAAPSRVIELIEA